MVEPRIVVPAVAGSSPVGHPTGAPGSCQSPRLQERSAEYESQKPLSGMTDNTSRDQALDVRQLAAAVNLFLKHTTPNFTVDGCVDAFIKALAQFIDGKVFFGYCWQPDVQLHERSPISLVDGVVSRGPMIAEEKSELDNILADSSENLLLTLHRSLRSFHSDTAARGELRGANCRGAIEIYFAYYSKPILWMVVGLTNAKILTVTETQEFLLLFCRCCLVSLHGAYVAKVERLERADQLPPSEQFNLALQWFHSIIRHLNVGISRLQSGKGASAADALDRASIVAGVCLAEMLSLRTKIPDRPSSEPLLKNQLSADPTAPTLDRLF
jgi:hypothetical protein